MEPELVESWRKVHVAVSGKAPDAWRCQVPSTLVPLHSVARTVPVTARDIKVKHMMNRENLIVAGESCTPLDGCQVGVSHMSEKIKMQAQAEHHVVKFHHKITPGARARCDPT